MESQEKGAEPSAHYSQPSTSTVGAVAQPQAGHSLRKRPWRQKVTPWEDIINHQYKGEGTEESPYVVSWIPTDPENPQTYGFTYKWGVTILGTWDDGVVETSN